MQIKKKNSDDERRILIGMIVNTTVLGRMSSKWQDRMFRSRWANIIAQWCLKYYKKYDKPPMQQIESLYETWAEKSKDETVVTLVEKFLYSISDEYEDLKEEINPEYVIDLAGKYLNKVKLERLVEQIEEDIEQGHSDKSIEHVTAFNRVEMGVGAGINVMQDIEVIRQAFAVTAEPIIKYPSKLGEFFANDLLPSCFISFMGKAGVGKSWWLMDIAYRAALQRKRVAYFEVGDMGQTPTMLRLIKRAAGRPLTSGDYEYPLSIDRKPKKKPYIEFESKSVKGDISWRDAVRNFRRIMKKRIKSKDSYLKLSCHYNSTLSVMGLESILNEWILDGWIPDVVIIDYADILLMEYADKEGRDCINETWKRLRALSQKFHVLLVTATQGDAGSYDKKMIGMGNFSEDRRKIDSVTGMIGINQTDKWEEEVGLYRLNWIKRREAKRWSRRCVHVASCLDIANPCVKSCW